MMFGVAGGTVANMPVAKTVRIASHVPHTSYSVSVVFSGYSNFLHPVCVLICYALCMNVLMLMKVHLMPTLKWYVPIPVVI